MKKLLTLLIVFTFSIPAMAELDEFYQSNAFEPMVGCVVGGAVGYAVAPQANQVAYAAGGCVVTGLLTYVINKHYENKYSKAYTARIDRLEEHLKQFEELQANKAANGDEGPYSLRVREIVPAQVLDNGAVRAPTITEKLIIPGLDQRIGD